MRIFVAVNKVAEIGHRQTTGLLIAALIRRGCEVWLANVEDFSVVSAPPVANVPASQNPPPVPVLQIFATAARMPTIENCTSREIERAVQSNLRLAAQSIQRGDMILIRTNPGRDTLRTAIHESFLEICRAAVAFGVRVVNDPTHLRYYASKGCLAALDPRYCPPLIVSNRPDRIIQFILDANVDCVIKPLVGSRGENVIRVSANTPDLRSVIAETFGVAGVIAQHFVHADHPGDKRIVTLGGRVLEIDGQIAGIERRPAADDFRANLHAGGTAHRVSLSASARATAQYAAELLNAYGIWLAGVDLIGDKIIEFNVFSTGGLFGAEEFSGICFSDAIVDELIQPKTS